MIFDIFALRVSSSIQLRTRLGRGRYSTRIIAGVSWDVRRETWDQGQSAPRHPTGRIPEESTEAHQPRRDFTRTVHHIIDSRGWLISQKDQAEPRRACCSESEYATGTLQPKGGRGGAGVCRCAKDFHQGGRVFRGPGHGKALRGPRTL